MGQTIFWGAGKIGQQILQFWKTHQICPDFFCDNREEAWGTEIEGVKIVPPQQAYAAKDTVIYITCGSFHEISAQLMQNGIREENIVRADSIYSKDMLCRMLRKLCVNLCEKKFLEKEGCMLDLSLGMALGGVERWSYSVASVLKEAGMEGCYLAIGNRQNTVIDETFPLISINSDNNEQIKYMLDLCIETIAGSGYKKIICNFPFDIFLAACIVKKTILPDLHIVAVIHNDESIYYDTYYNWRECIDECLVISSRMKKALVEKGFPSKKIKELYWKIYCEDEFTKQYSQYNEQIHIGYAGRLTKRQKRVDLILDAAEKLIKRGVDFILQMAGTGDYEETLRSEIASRKLTHNVILEGLIDHKEIPQFWKRQDIYLSCSDWEGHSISQSEAMAAGAVPVVTDTSGVEDDIREGYNGYIVPLEDVNAIADRIEYLYLNRDVLQVMGKRNWELILERNKSIDEELYWKNILGY